MLTPTLSLFSSVAPDVGALWLGGVKAVTHDTWMSDNNVNAVLSVAKNLALFLPKYGKAIARLHLAKIDRRELQWHDTEEQVNQLSSC